MTDFTGRLLLERIQREALTILFDGLNDKINVMQPTWVAEDESLLYALGRGNSGWTVEEVPDENFYPGTIPSLIKAPVEKYPNVCVICYRGVPRNSLDDTAELYMNVMAVEIMTKSGFYDPNDVADTIFHEQEVNSRIQKTLDAAHLTLLGNRTLNQVVPEIPAPNVSVGDIFVRTERDGAGNKWLWQGGSLEYNLDKYVNFVQ
jgi:hypothetical protein